MTQEPDRPGRHAESCKTRKLYLKKGWEPNLPTDQGRELFIWQHGCKTPKDQVFLFSGRYAMCFGCWHHCGSSGIGQVEKQLKMF